MYTLNLFKDVSCFAIRAGRQGMPHVVILTGSSDAIVGEVLKKMLSNCSQKPCRDIVGKCHALCCFLSKMHHTPLVCRPPRVAQAKEFFSFFLSFMGPELFSTLQGLASLSKTLQSILFLSGMLLSRNGADQHAKRAARFIY